MQWPKTAPSPSYSTNSTFPLTPQVSTAVPFLPKLGTLRISGSTTQKVATDGTMFFQIFTHTKFIAQSRMMLRHQSPRNIMSQPSPRRTSML